MKKFIKIFILLLLFLLFISNTELLINSSLNTFNYFIKVIFPTLFPVFIISNLLINYNFQYYIIKLFGKTFSKIFKTDSICCYIFIMSILTGFSSSYNILSNLYKNNEIDQKNINKIILFSHFINPIYLYSISSILLNNKIALYIIFITYITNIIIGLIFRNYNISYNNDIKLRKEYPLINILKDIILSSINNLFIILGTMVFISNISDLLIKKNTLFFIFLKGILDLTTGISLLNNFNFKLKIIYLVIFISFGSINTHIQCMSILNIDYKNYLKARLINVLLSILFIIPLIL